MSRANCPSGARLDEAQHFLDRNPTVEAIEIVLSDVNGIGRGKLIRRAELIPLFTEGRNIPMSMLVLDVTGADVVESGLVWETGDCDMKCWPIPGTLGVAAHITPPRGQLLLSMYDFAGSPVPADPRHVLAKLVDNANQRGYRPVGAFEVEFFLLERRVDNKSAPIPARGQMSGHSSSLNNTLSLDEVDAMSPFFDSVYEAARGMGINLEALISEFAPGQFELTIHHRDLLGAADDLIQVKRLLRSVARRHGLTACFMAKPFGHSAGSGMHLHLSLESAQGENIFGDTHQGEFSPHLLHAIGGVRATIAETMSLLAPHLNSWRRFAPGSYAPTVANWGENNRTVALRVPSGSARSRHFEHRVAGIDANPYLVAAATLAGVLKGLDERRDPGPPVTGNGYEELTSGVERDLIFPPDWLSAISRLETSAFAISFMGPVLHKAFCAVKRSEYALAAQVVTDYEYLTYLDNV